MRIVPRILVKLYSPSKLPTLNLEAIKITCKLMSFILAPFSVLMQFSLSRVD